MKLENRSYELQQITSSDEQLIVLLLLQKRYIEACKLCEQEEDSVQNFFNKGIAYYYCQGYELALSCFKEALSSIAHLLGDSSESMVSKENIEKHFYNKEREDLETLCMQGVTRLYVNHFTEITRFYLLCNILMCMEKLEMWAEIDTLSSTMYGKQKISFVQKLLAKSNAEKQ
ncbi:hypothetical protein GJV76_08540 [Myroides sp. BIT-d1]|uniref:Tetratricopeptide repeat protein n=1 Tax=Myroides albus TaxID=2562892 RepID=A0A6I3LQF5_9FLAO|nr:hypothetical protein [Myroides albus]MTG98175.1 hypothetical protein [Myroides albus]